jgi:hypothetical protein
MAIIVKIARMISGMRSDGIAAAVAAGCCGGLYLRAGRMKNFELMRMYNQSWRRLLLKLKAKRCVLRGKFRLNGAAVAYVMISRRGPCGHAVLRFM